PRLPEPSLTSLAGKRSRARVARLVGDQATLAADRAARPYRAVTALAVDHRQERGRRHRRRGAFHHRRRPLRIRRLGQRRLPLLLDVDVAAELDEGGATALRAVLLERARLDGRLVGRELRMGGQVGLGDRGGLAGLQVDDDEATL